MELFWLLLQETELISKFISSWIDTRDVGMANIQLRTRRIHNDFWFLNVFLMFHVTVPLDFHFSRAASISFEAGWGAKNIFACTLPSIYHPQSHLHTWPNNKLLFAHKPVCTKRSQKLFAFALLFVEMKSFYIKHSTQCTGNKIRELSYWEIMFVDKIGSRKDLFIVRGGRNWYISIKSFCGDHYAWR